MTSGVPYSSPIMFAVYINDMAEGVTSYMNMFVDDPKILKKVIKEEDCNALNQDLEKIGAWSQKWKMEFNAKKYNVLKFGKSRWRMAGNYCLNNERIMTKTEEKDLGVTVTDSLNFGTLLLRV